MYYIIRKDIKKRYQEEHKEERDMCTTKEMIEKINELKELEKLIEEAKEEAEALKDEIKQEMLTREVEELEVGTYIVRWTSVLSNRFDSTSFKKVMPEVYKAYTKQTTSRRFSISG